MSKESEARVAGTPNSGRRAAEAPNELLELEVNGLFGTFDYDIRFPHPPEGSSEPALVILHGPNGVGKTTLLLMLDGLMRLDFDVFRVRRFTKCSLTLTSKDKLTVERPTPDGPLVVGFRKHHVELHPVNKGANRHQDQASVEALRQEFRAATADIHLELITTSRSLPRDESRDALRADVAAFYAQRHEEDSPNARLRARLRAGTPDDRAVTLAATVRRFITDAQVNYRQFFRAEPELFARIFQVIEGDEPPNYDPEELIHRADQIDELDRLHLRLGLQPDLWNHADLVTLLKKLQSDRSKPWALAAVGAYLEGLESRAEARGLVAGRLLTFERILNDFLKGKRVEVGGREGLRILAGDDALNETQLSSGEFHLLYLMVSALVARRRGTVIAIDEPELSMHISWQRRLIQSLFAVASHARPQLILATHSPDVVAEYRPYMVPLGDVD
jgi:energy-coupling factor transporter ATP-binding protein EcfA2